MFARKNFLTWGNQSIKNPYCLHVFDKRQTCHCGEESENLAWTLTKEPFENPVIPLGYHFGVYEQRAEYHRARLTLYKGESPLCPGLQHHWEFKITEFFYDRSFDVMIGIGTNDWDLNLHDISKRYLDFKLGDNCHSWCFTNRGTICHNGSEGEYGEEFGVGSLIGVHLDNEKGTLQFFLNRVSMGVAFTGLPRGIFYPVVVTKSAKTKLKLVSSGSFKSNLEFLSTKILVQQVQNNLICEVESEKNVIAFKCLKCEGKCCKILEKVSEEIPQTVKQIENSLVVTDKGGVFSSSLGNGGVVSLVPHSEKIILLADKFPFLFCKSHSSNEQFSLELKVEMLPLPSPVQEYIYTKYWDFFRTLGYTETKKNSFSLTLNYVINFLFHNSLPYRVHFLQ